MNKLKLGILYKDKKIVNHRSLLKVLFNPILRYFGYCIATKLINNKLGSILIIKQEKVKNIKWNFNNHNDFDIIIKKRIIF
jgi:hypothetical protein